MFEVLTRYDVIFHATLGSNAIIKIDITQFQHFTTAIYANLFKTLKTLYKKIFLVLRKVAFIIHQGCRYRLIYNSAFIRNF